MAKKDAKVQVEQQDNGKFEVVEGDDIIEKDVENETEAKAIAAEYEQGDEIAQLEADDEDAQAEAGEEKTEHNPQGLSVHERIHRLIQTLGRHGLHNVEDAHPAQNPQTADSNYVKPQHS